MRILLVSDTHGKLGCIDRLARETGASAVFHAGDFGFYDADSVRRLSVREVALAILHSDLSKPAIDAARRMTPQKLVQFAAESLSLSDLPQYLSGERRFAVPVYAVWGNHEDKSVVEAMRHGSAGAGNLLLLDERAGHRVGPFHVFGLGGNVLHDDRLFQKPIAGGGGKIWSTLSQFGRLLETVGPRADAGEIRVLVTHVSPGKEPLVGRLAAHLQADFMVSGHMGSPYCSVWSEFGIRELADTERWLDSIQPALEQLWRDAEPGIRDLEERRWVERGLELVRSLPAQRVRASRGAVEPPWYRDTFAINLPDAAAGHAVLIAAEGRVALETHSAGRSFAAGP